MAELQVDPDVLAEIARRLDGLSVSLDVLARPAVSPGDLSPVVDGAAHDATMRATRSATGLSHDVRGMRDALLDAARTYVETDTDVARAARGER